MPTAQPAFLTTSGRALALSSGGLLKPRQPTALARLVGYVPGTLNMLPWTADARCSDFTDSQYTTTGCSVVGGLADLDGGTSGQKLVESASSGAHYVQSPSGPQCNARQPPIVYRLAVIAKALERSRFVLFHQNFQDSTFTTSVGFDVGGGNVGHDTSVGASATLVATGITSIGGGRYLCTMDVKYTAATTLGSSIVWQPKINIDNGTGTAARSISYTGDGASGIEILWFSMMPLAAWNITEECLYDDFVNLNTIDVNNTKTGQYNWRTSNLWPTSYMPTFGWATDPPSSPTPADNLTVSSSVLKIYNPNAAGSSAGYTSQIWTAADDGAGGYIGSAWKGPLLFESSFYYDGTYENWNGKNYLGHPSVWMMPIECLTNQMAGKTKFVEWDIYEATVDPNGLGGQSGPQEWSNPLSPSSVGISGGAFFKPVRLGTFIRVSGLWLTAASTGTTWGCYYTFYNGQFWPFFDGPYNTTDDDPGSEGDGMSMVGIIDTGEVATGDAGGWAMHIGDVRILRDPNL